MYSRLGSPWATIHSSILFIAPMKKMMRSWDIAMVIRLQAKMGVKTERRNGTASEGNKALLGEQGGAYNNTHLDLPQVSYISTHI